MKFLKSIFEVEISNEKIIYIRQLIRELSVLGGLPIQSQIRFVSAVSEAMKSTLKSGESGVVRCSLVSENGADYKLHTYVENKNGLAFDHAKVIQYALDRMKNKVMYTDIAFSLMPELFTLTELQKVYEVLYSRELADAYFRKKVKRMLTKTTLLSEGKRFRPSKLYLFNPRWKEKDDEE